MVNETGSESERITTYPYKDPFSFPPRPDEQTASTASNGKGPVILYDVICRMALKRETL